MTVLETWDFILLSHQVIICKQGPTVKQSFKLFIEFLNIHLATGDLNMRITQVLLNWDESLSTKVITMHLLRPYYVPGKEETSMHFFLLSHAISTPLRLWHSDKPHPTQNNTSDQSCISKDRIPYMPGKY